MIVEPKGDSYEVADGQQRITTIFLTLCVLFNQYCQAGGDTTTAEQRNILRFLQKGDHFILRNDTVGDFIHQAGNKLIVDISQDKDIYRQDGTFHRVFREIEAELLGKDINNFKGKLLDSRVLILISDETGYSKSIEQMYIDINDKIQRLEAEDIFKGYCFKNYNRDDHEELKDQWAKLKSTAFRFSDYGYKNLSEYLYYYFLSRPGTYDIPQTLKINNKHYLDGKNADETKQIVDDLVSYGNDIIRFTTRLSQDTYQFDDICPAASGHQPWEYHVLRKMCRAIITIQAAQYYKFPFLMIIHFLNQAPELQNELSMGGFKKLVTNYYIYATLFLQSKQRKSKDSIDHTIPDILYDDQPDKMRRILRAVKELRVSYQNSYDFPRRFYLNHALPLYSIIDYYDAPENFLRKLYLQEEECTQEHLILHNYKMTVQWVEDQGVCTFDFSTGDKERVDTLKQHRGSFANYLLLDKSFNNSLKRYDIVEKVRLIKEHFHQRMPNHVAIILGHIESLCTYQTLLSLKGQSESFEYLEDHYYRFLEEYFSGVSIEALHKKLFDAFLHAFTNDTSCATATVS